MADMRFGEPTIIPPPRGEFVDAGPKPRKEPPMPETPTPEQRAEKFAHEEVATLAPATVADLADLIRQAQSDARAAALEEAAEILDSVSRESRAKEDDAAEHVSVRLMMSAIRRSYDQLAWKIRALKDSP